MSSASCEAGVYGVGSPPFGLLLGFKGSRPQEPVLGSRLRRSWLRPPNERR